MTRMDSKTTFPHIVTVKRFWRTGTVVTIAIAEHKDHHVLEIIPFVESKIVDGFYLSTPLLFAKCFDDREYQGITTPPNDSEDTEKAFQILAVEYIRPRLVIPLKGPLVVSLKALPTDKTKGDGELDIICDTPPLLVKLTPSAFEDLQSRTWKFWTTSVPKTEELFKGTEKTKANFHRSISFENDTSERMPSVMASLWRSAFRRILFVIEIARTRSRLQSMNIACNSPRRQSSLLPGYEPTGHSDIFGQIAIQECNRSDDSDQEVCHANPPIINYNSLSWDKVFTHSGETCQKSINVTHKWAMDEAAPTDVSLGNTTLFNRSQIRKTRYSLQPILASLGIEHAKSEFGSSQRSVIIQPFSTSRRTSRNLNRTGDIEASISRTAGRASLKLLNLRGDFNDDPVSPMQTSPNQNSSDFEAPDTSPKPALDCSESSFWLESKLASETVYELSQQPRHRSSLTPLAWKANIKIDQLCGKLPERLVSRQNGPQNGSSITQEYFPPRMTSTRRSLGQIRIPGPKDSSRDSRRRSSGCMADNGIYYRRHLAPDINSRRAMLMERPKKGLHTSRRRDASASIPEGFATYEKDKDPGIESDCSNFFSSSPQDLFVSVAAEESNSAFEDEISSASVHLRTSIAHRKSIDSGKLFSKCDASRRIRHSSESLLSDTLSLTVMSP